MSEKPKITLKELRDIYDIEDTENIPEKENKNNSNQNSEFETYTEDYDKAEEEKIIEEQNG